MYGSDIDGSLDHSVNSVTNVNWYSGKSAMFGDRLVNNVNGYARNTLRTADGRSIPLRFYIVSNRSGNENIWLDNQWTPTHSTLQGNSYGYRLG